MPLAGGPVAVVPSAIGWQAVAPLVGGPVAVVAPLTWRWVATSHSRTVPSTLALARVLPSGLNATEVTEPVWPVRELPACRPAATGHNRTGPFMLPLARVLPSGLNATETITEYTPLVWPVTRSLIGCPGAAGTGMIWRVTTRSGKEQEQLA